MTRQHDAALYTPCIDGFIFTTFKLVITKKKQQITANKETNIYNAHNDSNTQSEESPKIAVSLNMT